MYIKNGMFSFKYEAYVKLSVTWLRLEREQMCGMCCHMRHMSLILVLYLHPQHPAQPLAVVSSQHFEDPAEFGSVSHSV